MLKRKLWRRPATKPKGFSLTALLAAAAVAALCCVSLPSAQALEPADVCVIYNTRSNASQALAQFYVHARKIPERNLIGLICTVGESITENEYRHTVVPQMKQALAQHPGVKCLVTTYDVPLKIGDWRPTFPQRQEINTFKVQLDSVIDEMDKSIGGYEAVAPATTTQPASAPASAPANVKRTWQDEVNKLNVAANAAIGRINHLSGPARSAAMLEFIKVHQKVAGITGLLVGFQVRADSPDADAVNAQRNRLQNQLTDLNQRAEALIQDRDNPAARKELVMVRREAAGLVGEAREIDGVLTFLEPVETESCFDNELALVLADQDYPRGRWLPNFNNIDFYPPAKHFPKVLPSLLVTRIDGPSLAVAENMITLGIKTEKAGLRGKIYLDARDIHTGAYAVFDDDLRQLAAWLKTNSTMECVLDDKPALLQAKNCPDAALYCGWYSLRKYVDSCQWLPGGVGYHVASSEMVSLHNPGETGWVANLLKRGYCGTLGPTAEPYLSSFPNPAHFFPLLLSGEFTQGEVWEVTDPMLSWRTGYVGDPLYNPFKNDPYVKIAALKADPILKNAFAILRPAAAIAPASPQK